ncbi:MAG: hypothetical protein FWE57_10865, partial [Chitinispirillia bacterium]|nr:hypothetical protein [Chitinispirillia bacterium]
MLRKYPYIQTQTQSTPPPNWTPKQPTGQTTSQLAREQQPVAQAQTYSLGRNDEEPNIELAKELVKTKNKKGIKEIVDGLNNSKEQIANDCIKVLYEIAEIEPKLVSEYADNFIQLLKSKNNRLVWGSMTAISKITSLNPDEIFKNLDTLVKAYEKGSVITV